jgi:hypothetical protein
MTVLFLYVGNILTGAGQANRSMLNAGDGGLSDRVADLEKKLLTFQRRWVLVSELLIASSNPFIDLLETDALHSLGFGWRTWTLPFTIDPSFGWERQMMLRTRIR